MSYLHVGLMVAEMFGIVGLMLGLYLVARRLPG